MAKRLVLSRKAILDIDRIIEFNNHRNKSDSYSRKFIKQINERLMRLLEFPHIGVKTDLENEFVLI